MKATDNKKPNCYMDFDGTINDNSPRLYQFFIDNAPADMGNIITPDEFWQMKRLGIHEADWMNAKFGSGIDKDEWNVRKIKNIERPEYLKYDRLYAFALEALEQISLYYNVYIITRRNNKAGVLRQVESYGIKPFISGITVVVQGERTKAEVIRDNYGISSDDIIVGDTEDDLFAGQDLGITTYFVLSGIRSRWILRKMGIEDNEDIKVVDSIMDVCRKGDI